MEQSELLAYFTEVLDRLNLSYLVTGSIATSYYGEPRFTNDIDVIVELRENEIEAFCGEFPANDFYLSPQAVHAAAASKRQFNILHPQTGLKIDVFVISKSEFDQSRFQRRRLQQIDENFSVWFASPEDVILKKLVYFREGNSEKHIRDILGVLKIQGSAIDLEYISDWANRLALTDLWHDVRARFEGDNHKS